MTHLQNQFTLGTDLYPKTITAAYNLSIKWKNGTEEKQQYQKRFVPLEGVSLTTDVDDGERDYSRVKCFFCEEMGHIATHCPKKKKKKADKKRAKEVAATTATTGHHTILRDKARAPYPAQLIPSVSL